MDPVTLGMAKAHARRTFATRRGRRPVARNVHLLARSTESISDGVAFSVTSRYRHVVDIDCTSPELVFCNWYNNGGTDADGSSWVLVKSFVHLGDGTALPVLFDGQPTAWIPPGGQSVGQFGTTLNRGDVIFSQTNIAVFSGDRFPLGRITDSTQTEGVVAGDFTEGSVAASAVRGYGPWAILGVPTLPVASPSVLFFGDSRVVGYGDPAGTADTRGWVSRAFDGNLSYLNLGISGSSVLIASTLGYLRRRLALANLCQFDAAVVVYGINDIIGGATAAEVEARLSALYGFLADTGIPVYGGTVSPVTSSTDDWQTTVNQTTAAHNTERVTLNNWIRTTPAPLSGFFELADAVESARDSGLWKASGVPFGFTADGVHESSGGAAAEAAVVDPSTFGPLLEA